MKTLLTITSSLALAALLLPAQAQTPATTHDNPTPARATPTTPRSMAGKQAHGPAPKPEVGRQFVAKSKPYDSTVPTRPRKITAE